MIACYSPGTATYRSATDISHGLGELVGQFDSVQRSLHFRYVGLEHGSHQLYISPIRATRVKRSNRCNHCETQFPLIFLLPAPWRLVVTPMGRQRPRRALAPHAPRITATGRTLLINAAKNAAGSVMKAKCPALASRINSFFGALTRSKYSIAALVGVVTSSRP
jgi:hypothetical protein